MLTIIVPMNFAWAYKFALQLKIIKVNHDEVIIPNTISNTSQ